MFFPPYILYFEVLCGGEKSQTFLPIDRGRSVRANIAEWFGTVLGKLGIVESGSYSIRRYCGRLFLIIWTTGRDR